MQHIGHGILRSLSGSPSNRVLTIGHRKRILLGYFGELG